MGFYNWHLPEVHLSGSSDAFYYTCKSLFSVYFQPEMAEIIHYFTDSHIEICWYFGHNI